MKKTIAGLAGAMLAFASTNVFAQTNMDTKTQDTTVHKTTKSDTDMAQQNQEKLPVAGVVTGVDKKTNTLTIVVPGSTSVDMTKYGKALMTEQDANLISLKAPIGQGAPLVRDGKSAKLADIKEGDVVRTSFDPNAMSFIGVNAVSQKQIDKDISAAKKELSKEIKTMEKSGKKMNE